MELWMVLLAVFVICIYYYSLTVYRYWDNKGVPCLKPDYLRQDVYNFFKRKTSFVQYYTDLYFKLSPHRFAVIYNLWKPSLMVRDPELIRLMLTKDFNHFQDRGVKVRKEVDTLLYHLANMEGDEWKNMRTKLTNTFSSGKMKIMFPLVQEYAKELENILHDYAADFRDFEAKELCSRLTTDIVSSCAFGLNTNSLKDPNSEFRIMANRALFEAKYKRMIRFMFPNLPLAVIKFFNIKLMADDVEKFFYNVANDTVKYRKENNVKRNDFLDLIISLKNNAESAKSKDHTDENEIQTVNAQFENKIMKSKDDMKPVLASQCFGLLAGGPETLSTVLSFLLMELAQHQDVQNKLRLEIKEAIKNSDNEITYSVLQKVPYMDMVLSETFRKYPTMVVLIRVCTQKYQIPNTDIVIPEKTPVVIPIIGLNHDPLYYSEPEKFKPEHFSADEKSKRPRFVYLPFGDGPRNCIGERFSLMVLKIGTIYLLKEYEFHSASRMKFPIKFANNPGLPSVQDGIWVKCKKIKNKN